MKDRFLSSQEHTKFFGATNPFDWMKWPSLQSKTHIFERHEGEYQKAGVMASLTQTAYGAKQNSNVQPGVSFSEMHISI